MFGIANNRRSSKSSSRHRRSFGAFESLEQRAMFSGNGTDVRLENGNLIIVGDERPNAVKVFHDTTTPGQITVLSARQSALDGTGKLEHFDAASVKRVLFFGGGGDDKFTIEDMTGLPVWAALGDGDNSFRAAQSNGNHIVIGGQHKDTIIGGLGHDCIDGKAGDDVIYGLEGDDALFGGDGDDIIDGGGRNDWLFGGRGWDRLYGGPGTDFLDGGKSAESGLGDNECDILYLGDTHLADGAIDFVMYYRSSFTVLFWTAGETEDDVQGLTAGTDVLINPEEDPAGNERDRIIHAENDFRKNGSVLGAAGAYRFTPNVEFDKLNNASRSLQALSVNDWSNAPISGAKANPAKSLPVPGLGFFFGNQAVTPSANRKTPAVELRPEFQAAGATTSASAAKALNNLALKPQYGLLPAYGTTVAANTSATVTPASNASRPKLSGLAWI